jgi:predicted nucleic acid-binding Zn ribbon protein
MSKKIERLSILLNRTLASHGLTTRLKEYRVVGRWEKIVGKVIARHAQPLSLRGKKLSVAVDSSAWMQQLSLLKPELVEKLNHGLGAGSIQDITFKMGTIAPGEKPSLKHASPVTLDKDAREKIEQYVQNINDLDVKQTLRRLIEKDLVTKRKAREK